MPPQSHDSSGKQWNPAPIRLGKDARRGKSSAGVLHKRSLDPGTDPGGNPPTMRMKARNER
jgi:hypothetical protein